MNRTEGRPPDSSTWRLCFIAACLLSLSPPGAWGQQSDPPLPPLPATSSPGPDAVPPDPPLPAAGLPNTATTTGSTPAGTPAASVDDPQSSFQVQLASPAGFGFPIPPSPAQLPDVNPGAARPAGGSAPVTPLDKLKAGYRADLSHRIGLTDDWGGARSSLVDRGLIFYADSTQFYQGVGAGGLRQQSQYYGHNDYVALLLGEKLGLWEGFFVKIRGETRFGESVSTNAGTILPTAINASLPVPNRQVTALTELLFIQKVGDRLLLQAGKFTTLDGDALTFAGGRGKTQFSNSALVFNPIFARTIPYDTLGAGFVVLSKGFNPLLAFSVLDPNQSPTTSGFPIFRNGVTLSGATRVPVSFFGQPGHQGFTGAWSSGTFRGLEFDPRVLIQGGPLLPRRTGSYALGYSFDQYLWHDPTDPKRGWGLFGRLGISDGDPNPLKYFWSVGLGGTGPIATRPHDNWGVAYFDGGVSKNTVLDNLLHLQDGYGVEMFYNFALAGWARLTPDLQVIRGGLPRTDTALVLGLRLQVVF